MKRVIVNGVPMELEDGDGKSILERMKNCKHPIESLELIGYKKPRCCKSKNARKVQVFRCGLCGKTFSIDD